MDMRLIALEEIRSQTAVRDQSKGYNLIYHPIEWYVAYIELDPSAAALLPAPSAGNNALMQALKRRVDADKYEFVKGSRQPEISVHFRLVGDHPFQHASSDDVARAIAMRVKNAIADLKEIRA